MDNLPDIIAVEDPECSFMTDSPISDFYLKPNYPHLNLRTIRLRTLFGFYIFHISPSHFIVIYSSCQLPFTRLAFTSWTTASHRLKGSVVAGGHRRRSRMSMISSSLVPALWAFSCQHAWHGGVTRSNISTIDLSQPKPAEQTAFSRGL